jgi:hypothetical protein
MSYKLTPGGVLKDGMTYVPNDPANCDWRAYLEWLELGNTPGPADVLLVVEPASVTMRQARLQLLSMGLLGQVDQAMAALQGTAGDVARIEWEFAATVEKSNATAKAIMAALELNEEQVSLFFEEASRL